MTSLAQVPDSELELLRTMDQARVRLRLDSYTNPDGKDRTFVFRCRTDRRQLNLEITMSRISQVELLLRGSLPQYLLFRLPPPFRPWFIGLLYDQGA